MSNFSWKLLFAIPAAYAISFFTSANAFATSNVKPAGIAITAAPGSLDEVGPVATPDLVAANGEQSAESGVLIQPSDWQYTSLKSLDSKYNCGADLTGAPISRENFATALNSCLQKAEPILAKAKAKKTIRKKPTSIAPAPAAPTSPEVAPAPAPEAVPTAPAAPAPIDTSAQDIEALKRLTQEFRAELSNLDVRVQKVEKTVLAQSQASQFSTTTKLKGEVVIGLNGVLSGGGAGSNTTIGDRVRLLFETSFTGKDKLYTRLAAGNVSGFGNLQGTPVNAAGTEGALTSAGVTGPTGNGVVIDWLAYQFPIGSGSVYAAAYNGVTSDYADTHNPYFEDFTGGSGALSSFAEENPIYKIGGGTGIGLTLPLSGSTNKLLDSVNLGYFGGTAANSPAAGSGIFGGRNAILAQVNFKPSDKFDFGLAYVRGFHNNGAIFDFGSGGAIVGSSLTGPTVTPPATAAVGYDTSNSFGLSAAYKASDNLSLNGFVTTTSADRTGGGNDSILTYALGAAFPNVGQPGNLLGIFAGQSPSLTNAANGNSYHLEGFYKYKLNDGLSITPGLIYLTNPNQAGNGGSLLGTVRTTFTF
jgi:Carbohydrate-selective porin, OprB family